MPKNDDVNESFEGEEDWNDDEEEEEEEEDDDDDDDNDEAHQDRRPLKKTKTDKSADDDTDVHHGALLSAHPLDIVEATSTNTKSPKQPPIIILLDQATLETVKNKRGIYELLNCDDHREYCKKKLRKDPNDFRPDILHQELLALLDSPLNKAGLLKVYIHTEAHVLIDVHPSIRIPRTYKRFAGLMVQLLHKMKIKAGTESTTLLKVIKNPFSQYLPAGTHCYGFSCQGTLYSPVALARDILPMTPQQATTPTCLIVGAMSTGHVTIEDHPYMEKMFSISQYPLSGAAALSRVVGGIEHLWGIV